MQDRFYLKQLRAGRDFGTSDQTADGMANFVYLLGDSLKRECLVVDPAWDVAGILACAALDEMKVTGALITHWHPDHVGGPFFGGMHIDGLDSLLKLNPVPIHVHRAEADFVRRMTGVSASDLVLHDSGDKVLAGEVEIECLHTPGHTAGGQCFKCGSALIAGDTLFLQGCGRLDLPTADPVAMYDTLYHKLAALPGDTVLYPGHDYGAVPNAPLSEVRRTNSSLQMRDQAAWLRLQGVASR